MAGEHPITILIVEDDPSAVRLMEVRLHRIGYQTLTAATSQEALALLKQHNVDLMLLDQNLSGGETGLELYRKVQEAKLTVPAILVTGFSGESIVLQSFRSGVYDFVPKTPDYLDYLLPTIERVLKKHQTECQLVESEARLASIFQSTSDAVLTVDEQQHIAICNPAAEQMFGIDCGKARGLPITRCLPAWTTRVNAGTIERWETEGLRTDGHHFPVEVSISWVDGPRRGFWTCVARDVSERRRAQEERERLIREQIARVEAEAARERLEAIASENDRLYKELRHVDRLKDVFLAMLAHELRNPLAPIRNALHLLQLDTPTLLPAAAETWAVIDRQVTHLVRLVDDLLDVSRISQGKIQLQKEHVDLAEVVQRAVESSKPLVESRRHAFTLHSIKEPLPIKGDVVRLVQVLSNLLNNAAKYTPEEGRIEMTVTRKENRAEVRVRDTGAGIPAEILPRLFDLFTQSERTLDRAEGGLGIGLTLVRRLTEMHGGSVEAFSAGPGKGSEFIVRLPLSTEPVRPAPAHAPPAAESGSVPRRILLVDDNEDSVRTLSRLLEVMGHEVRSATSGLETLSIAKEFAPDVILLDIGLPGMDGLEVSRRLRTQAQFDKTVLVALTGYGSPEDRQHTEEAGFNAHLVKPVDLTALKELLARPSSLLA